MALERELAIFSHSLHEWKEYEGKFVLICSDDVIDFFASYEEAVKVGYDRCRLQPILVKQIQPAAF